MHIASKQIKAARAMLDWSQEDLAQKVGVSRQTIFNIEFDKTQPNRSTIEKIISVFKQAGIQFVAGGVRESDGSFKIEGKGKFVKLLDDVYHSLKVTGGELLILGGDERKNREGVEAAVRRIRGAGIKMRVIVEANNDYFLAPLNEYRKVPSKYYEYTVTVIYGGKVAIALQGGEHTAVQVIDNPILAQSFTKIFNFMWDTGTQPTFSSTEQIYHV